MSKKIKIKVYMVPLEWTPGAEFAKEREINVEIADSGYNGINVERAKTIACVDLDCNKANYAFGVTNLAIAEGG